MDMGSSFGAVLGTIQNYERDPYVHYKGSFNKANIDSSSYIDPSILDSLL